MLDGFDQSGYDLYEWNKNTQNVTWTSHSSCVIKDVLNKDWVFSMGNSTDAHINHSDLYEGKEYRGYALEQLHNWDYWAIIYYTK